MARQPKDKAGLTPEAPHVDFPQDSPTYRGEIDWSSEGCSSSHDIPEQDWSWGLDTVKFSFYVNPAHCDPPMSSPLWSKSGTQNLRNDMPEAERYTGWYLPDVDWEAKVKVDLYALDNLCHLEFNAPRMLTPIKECLLRPDALAAVVARVIEGVKDSVWPVFIKVTDGGEIVWDDDWETQVRNTRLDLSRNLEVEDTQVVKMGCGATTGRYQRGKRLFESNGGWTVESPTASVGKDKIYDKTAELGRNPEDADRMAEMSMSLVRFETQLMRARLKDNGLSRLSDVNARSVWKALEARWEATRWGSPLPVRGEVAEAMSALSPKNKLLLTGYLHHAAVSDTADQSETTHRNMKKLARQCGLTIGLPVDLMGAPDSYLDLRIGRIQHLTPLLRLVAEMED